MSEITKIRNVTSVSVPIKTDEGTYTIPPNSSVQVKGNIMGDVPKGIFKLTNDDVMSALALSRATITSPPPAAVETPVEEVVEPPVEVTETVEALDTKSKKKV